MEKYERNIRDVWRNIHEEVFVKMKRENCIYSSLQEFYIYLSTTTNMVLCDKAIHI